jgi:oligogalacturonide lyase
MKDGTIYATNLDTGTTRAIVTKPELRSGSGLAVNADETLLAGSFVDDPKAQPAVAPPPTKDQDHSDNPPGKGEMMERRLAARLPMALYTVEIRQGKSLHSTTARTGSTTFSSPLPIPS